MVLAAVVGSRLLYVLGFIANPAHTAYINIPSWSRMLGSEIKSFCSEALVWFNSVNNTEIDLSNKQITLNEISHVHQLSEYPKSRLVIFVILLKQYVYSCKCFEKNTDLKRIPNENIDAIANIEMCALLILLLPSLKLKLQKEVNISSNTFTVALITTHKHYCIEGRLRVVLRCLSIYIL